MSQPKSAASFARLSTSPGPTERRLLRELVVERRRREQAETELRTWQNRFRLFLDHAPMPAFIRDEQGRHVYGNKRWAAQFDRPLEELMYKTNWDLFPKDTALIFEASDQAARQRQIGRILAALRQTGLAENTLVVFAADNGLALGSHGLLGKQSVFEHSMRVLLIMVGPGIPGGKSTIAFTYLLDLFPTLCDVLSIRRPAGLEGESLRPLWEGKRERARQRVPSVHEDSTCRKGRTLETDRLPADRPSAVVRPAERSLRNKQPDRSSGSHGTRCPTAEVDEEMAGQSR